MIYVTSFCSNKREIHLVADLNYVHRRKTTSIVTDGDLK